MIAVLLFLSACTPRTTVSSGDGGASGDSGGGADTPTPWSYDTGGGGLSSISADQAAAVLQEAIDDAFSYDPGVLLEAYDEALTYRDDTCIEFYEAENDTVYQHRWLGFSACQVPESSDFTGQSWAYTATDAAVEDHDAWSSSIAEVLGTDFPDLRLSGRFVGGQAYIDTPSGDQYWASGTMGYTVGEDPSRDLKFWIRELTGTFSWSGDSANGTWLEHTSAADWYVRINANPAAPLPRSVVLEGSLVNQPVTGGTFTTQSLTLSTAADCAIEFSGSFSVRDEDGRWAEVVFDADTGGLCDGCGVMAAGPEQGALVCVDSAALTEWEDAPW